MKKIIIAIAAMFIVISASFSQHRYLYTHYLVNPVIINSGATAFDGGHNLFVNYRNTWASFPDAPKTFSFNYDGRVGNKIGVGAFVMNDRFGALETFRAMLSYAYLLQGTEYKIGLGFTTEYIDYHVAGALNGGLIDRLDPYVATRQDGDKYFESAIGVHGVIQDKFLLSLSLPGLIRTKLQNQNYTTSTEEKYFNYILGVGYIFDSPEYKLKVTPSIFVKKLWKYNTFIDANLMFSFSDDRFSSGLTYSIGDEKTFGFLIGTKMNGFNFYYSYDFAFKDFQGYNSGSHELTVGYKFGKK